MLVDDDPVVDDDAVAFADMKEWSDEFDDVVNRIDSLFVHPGTRKHAEQYLRGLLAPLER